MPESPEPLWRGPLGEIFEPKHIALLRESPGTEVEVWPAGDRTCPYVETGDEGTSYCRLAEAQTGWVKPNGRLFKVHPDPETHRRETAESWGEPVYRLVTEEDATHGG